MPFLIVFKKAWRIRFLGNDETFCVDIFDTKACLKGRMDLTSYYILTFSVYYYLDVLEDVIAEGKYVKEMVFKMTL